MLCEIAEKYFSNINPLASRICGDIQRIKAAYEDLWQNFSPAEQEQIINETIIHPKVLLKYNLSTSALCGKGGCRFASGKKIVVDENTGVSWRDEHSAPFSWRTRSQLDLCHNKLCVPALPPSMNPVDLKELGNDLASTKLSINPPGAAEGANSSLGAFSDFCARFKSLPGKSQNYDVAQGSSGAGIFYKIKSNTMCKLQGTLRMVSGKVGSRRSGEGEMLVLGGRAVIVPRASPKKPTSPPPPPPPRILLQKDLAETPLLAPNTPSLDEKSSHGHPEETFIASDQPPPSPDSFELPDVPSLFNSAVSQESIVPKSGFDFLDNW